MKNLALLVMEKTFNGYLRLDPASQRFLAPLQEKTLQIVLTDLNWSSYWLFNKQGVRIVLQHNQPADTLIKGKLNDFLQTVYTSLQEQQTTPTLAKVEIQGDIETARQLQKLMRSINIDWEEIVAQLTGDVLAHQLGEQARSLFNWGRSTAGNLKQNLSEYLQEEARYLPTRQEIEDFCEDVSLLRHDVERLLARYEIYLNGQSR